MRKGPLVQESDGGPVCAGAFVIASVSCGRRKAIRSAARRRRRTASSCIARRTRSSPNSSSSAYEAKTGVKVLPLYDTEETKTAGLTARLVAEKARPKADVFWSSDTSRAVALVDQGLTTAYVPRTAAAIPDRYKSADGMWTGFGARIRVILYNTETVQPGEVPRSILDLTQPRWKGRFAIANPHFGTMSFQAAALFVEVGRRQGERLPAAAEGQRRRDRGGQLRCEGSGGGRPRGRWHPGRRRCRRRRSREEAGRDRDSRSGGTRCARHAAHAECRRAHSGAPHVEQGQRFIDFLVSADGREDPRVTATRRSIPCIPASRGRSSCRRSTRFA